MNNIPIFDSLTHPTINGDWILPNSLQKSKLDDLLFEMETNNVCNSFAVGMKSIGGYDETEFSEFILSRTNKLLPIAFFDLTKYNDIKSIQNNIRFLKSLKYRGIKLHPRFGHFSFLNPMLPNIIKAANDENMAVLLCTYFYENGTNVINNNLENLLKLLNKIPNEKLILLHSGTVRLLEMMEVARCYTKILLDLSFTLCKYKNSSLDLDIKFLFEKFDKRICIGSDHPEFSILEMRKRFEYFSKTIDHQKAINIANRNILNFLSSSQ